MTEPRERNFWDVPADLPTGAWLVKRRLAKALRDLVSLCVTTDATESALTLAADVIEKTRDALAMHPGRTFQQAYKTLSHPDDLAVFADRGTLAGESNPFAPPMTFTMEGEIAVGHVSFGAPFEGIPGHVHGGMVAAAFDQLFGYLQVHRAANAVTASLTIDYRRPTPILTPLRFEARVARVEGRKFHNQARLLVGETLLAEAHGVFVELDQRRMRDVVLGTPEARG